MVLVMYVSIQKQSRGRVEEGVVKNKRERRGEREGKREMNEDKGREGERERKGRKEKP